MSGSNRTPIEEAERRLKMNLSLVEMLKKNTSDEQIAKLRALWVEPWERVLFDLKAGTAHSADATPGQPRPAATYCEHSRP